MAEMTTDDVMREAKALYKSAQTTASISGARNAAKKAASLVYYLAKAVKQLEQGTSKKALSLVVDESDEPEMDFVAKDD